NLCLSHFIGSFHCYNTYADLVSLHPLFQFALCLTWAKYQNRFCITDARNYLIVVICEMPHIISFLRIPQSRTCNRGPSVGRYASWCSAGESARTAELKRRATGSA